MAVNATIFDVTTGANVVLNPSWLAALFAQQAIAGAFTTLSSTGLATVNSLKLDTGTKTATAVAGAATLNKSSGKVTSEALTTAGLANYVLTLTNSDIAAADQVYASVANGTNTQGTPAVGLVTPGAGSVTIQIDNLHATQAMNGTVVISYFIAKA